MIDGSGTQSLVRPTRGDSGAMSSTSPNLAFLLWCWWPCAVLQKIGGNILVHLHRLRQKVLFPGCQRTIDGISPIGFWHFPLPLHWLYYNICGVRWRLLILWLCMQLWIICVSSRFPFIKLTEEVSAEYQNRKSKRHEHSWMKFRVWGHDL
jgi:hypothetical protein